MCVLAHEELNVCCSYVCKQTEAGAIYAAGLKMAALDERGRL